VSHSPHRRPSSRILLRARFQLGAELEECKLRRLNVVNLADFQNNLILLDGRTAKQILKKKSRFTLICCHLSITLLQYIAGKHISAFCSFLHLITFCQDVIRSRKVGSMMAFSTLFLLISSKKGFRHFQNIFIFNFIR
jgi:hypothetical protein